MSIVLNIVKPIVSSIVKPIVKGIVTRYFTTLKSASLQYGSMTTPVACDRIVMDVYSPTGIATGLPTGATAPTSNKITTLDFAYAGVTLQEIGRNGASYFDGIISNVKLYSGSTLVAFIPWDGDGSASERNTVDPTNVMTLVNITSANAELYSKTGSVFVGSLERVVNPGFDVDSGYAKSAGATISGGLLRFNAVVDVYAYQDIMEIDWRYRISNTYNIDSGALGLYFGSNVGTGDSIISMESLSGSGVIKGDITSSSARFILRDPSGCVAQFDNWSVKKILETI